jgi:hypothetical protein
VHAHKNMNAKTKTIFVITGTILIVILVILFFILINIKGNYPKEPIKQTSLYYSNQRVELELSDLESKEYPLLGISNNVSLEKVKEFVLAIDPKMSEIANEEGSYYKWGNGTNYVIYELNRNMVTFKLKDGILWDEVDITKYSFSAFTKKYFGKEYEYELSLKELNTDGVMIYYANRRFQQQLIETAENKKQTDYLGMKGGKIVYGKIFLTEFINTKFVLPTLDKQGIVRYINIKNYPKEIYPNFSTLQTSVLKEVDYRSDDFVKITETLKNCKGNNISVVYLYKSFEQEYLMPVYKIDVMCEVSYKDEKYTVPATVYTNAVEPEYVLASE